MYYMCRLFGVCKINIGICWYFKANNLSAPTFRENVNVPANNPSKRALQTLFIIKTTIRHVTIKLISLLSLLQQTTLPENIINREIVEMSINGGNIIQFTPKTFNSLPGLSLLHINGTKKIVIERKTFYNLSSSSLLIEIQNCDQLIIKTGAFENILVITTPHTLHPLT